MSFCIRELRKQKKMTQEELALKSGISRTIISKLENGESPIAKTSTLSKIARALEVSVSQIYTG